MGQRKLKRWRAGKTPGLAVVVAACSLLGCANDDEAADSGGACIPYIGLNRGDALIAEQARILGFAVDEVHAYWLAWETPRGGHSTIWSEPDVTVLRVCELEHCEKTLQSFEVARSTEPYPSGWDAMVNSTASKWGKRLGLSDERVFWLSEASGLTSPTVKPGKGTGLEYCTKTDCSQLKHYSINDAIIDVFIVDGSTLVLATNESTLLTCDEADCDSTLKRLPFNVPASSSPDSGVKQLVADADFYYLAQEERFLRVRKDGSQPFEVLAQDVGVLGEMTGSGDNLYFARRFPAAVLSCPKAGCVGEPPTVVSNLHAPYGLLVENETIYISEPADVPLDYYTLPDADVGDDRMLRCSGADCTVITPGATGLLGPMSANRRDIYFTAFQGFDGCNDYFSIQHVAKDAAEAQ